MLNNFQDEMLKKYDISFWCTELILVTSLGNKYGIISMVTFFQMNLHCSFTFLKNQERRYQQISIAIFPFTVQSLNLMTPLQACSCRHNEFCMMWKTLPVLIRTRIIFKECRKSTTSNLVN